MTAANTCEHEILGVMKLVDLPYSPRGRKNNNGRRSHLFRNKTQNCIATDNHTYNTCINALFAVLFPYDIIKPTGVNNKISFCKSYDLIHAFRAKDSWTQ